MYTLVGSRREQGGSGGESRPTERSRDLQPCGVEVSSQLPQDWLLHSRPQPLRGLWEPCYF